MAKTLSKKNKLTILSTAGLALLVFMIVFIEVQSSRSSLLKIMEFESLNLIETMNRSIENSILTNTEIEDLLVKRLNSTAAYISNLEKNNRLHPDDLNGLSEEFDISLILLTDSRGNILQSNKNIDEDHKLLPDNIYNELKMLLNSDYQWLEIGLTDDPLENKQMYLLAYKRFAGKGFIIVGYETDKLLEFRKRIGIGKLVQDMADNADIVYILMQDTLGIVTASKTVKEISSINNDLFLQNVFGSEQVFTRIWNYEEKDVYEVAQTIKMDDGTKMLTRIGLSLDNVNKIQKNSQIRVYLIGAGIFILGSIFIAFMLTREKFQILTQEHKKFKSYTDLILDNMADAVVAVNQDLQIIFYNNSAELTFELTIDSNNNNYYNVFFPKDEILLKTCLENEKEIDFTEINYQTSAERNKILGLSISIIKESDGKVDTIFALIRDLTEEKIMQQKLTRKEKLTAMGELAGGVAHEIRNPLNAINIIAQRFEYEFEPSEDSEEYYKLVKTVRKEVERVNNIIKQFLEFAKPPKLNLEIAKINEIFQETVNVVESQANLNNIEISTNYSDCCFVRIDKQKFKQVLLNLLQNSIDAIPNSGTIKCLTKKSGDMLSLEISDNGMGIPKHIQQKIFNLYFTTKSHGTGLGLSIVHQIISEHNGEITFDSEEGKGTVMKILLPLVMPESIIKNGINAIKNDFENGSVVIAKNALTLVREILYFHSNKSDFPDVKNYIQEIIDAKPAMTGLKTLMKLSIAEIEKLDDYKEFNNIYYDFIQNIDRASNDVVTKAIKLVFDEQKNKNNKLKILTCSFSSLVLNFFITADKAGKSFVVNLLESEFQNRKYGAYYQNHLEQSGIENNLIPDTQIEEAISASDLILIGADSIIGGKGIVNGYPSDKLAEANKMQKPFIVLGESFKYSDKIELSKGFAFIPKELITEIISDNLFV